MSMDDNNDTAASQQHLQAAVAAMTNAAEPALFDVTIICTTDDYQAAYWMEQLAQGICTSTGASSSSSPFPIVLAVAEDWNDAGGAGNGLGTLYAFDKASKLAASLYPDMEDNLWTLLQQSKISAALYHTAGKGTRLAPLPASENNNKPGVKLPVCQPGTNPPRLWTVLEAVVKQTGVYAKSRPGRLSVFWGDQIFVPSAPYEYTPTHHVDILCTLLGDTAPTPEEWTAQGLDKYGVIAVLDTPDESAAQVEKVSHEQATQILSSLGSIQKVGPSLGSFSVSATMLQALCTEFKQELEEKTAKLDTDPHFWMPLTLPEAEYVKLMAQKGEDADFCLKHHQRMAVLKAKLLEQSQLGVLGAVNVGKEAGWWDYGQVKLYAKNAFLLLEPDSNADAKLLRQFLGVAPDHKSDTPSNVTVDDKSCVSSCSVTGATSGSAITNSVVASVGAQSIQATDAIVVNCYTTGAIVAPPGSILYNVYSNDGSDIVAEANQVVVQVTPDSGESFILRSLRSIDGKEAWSKVLEPNAYSFEQVNLNNSNANVQKIHQMRETLRQEILTQLQG